MLLYPIHGELADNEGKRARAGGHDGGMRAKARRARDMASVQYNYVSRATRELGSEGTRFQHAPSSEARTRTGRRGREQA